MNYGNNAHKEKIMLGNHVILLSVEEAKKIVEFIKSTSEFSSEFFTCNEHNKAILNIYANLSNDIDKFDVIDKFLLKRNIYVRNKKS